MAWLRKHKDVFEVTIPYSRAVKNAYPSYVAKGVGSSGAGASGSSSANKTATGGLNLPPEELRLSVRRRHTSYIHITEDMVAESVRQALPEDGTRWPLKYLLSTLPVEILDVIPLDVVPYLLSVGYPTVRLLRDTARGRFHIRRGVERDDGTAGEAFIEVWENKESGERGKEGEKGREGEKTGAGAESGSENRKGGSEKGKDSETLRPSRDETTKAAEAGR